VYPRQLSFPLVADAATAMIHSRMNDLVEQLQDLISHHGDQDIVGLPSNCLGLTDWAIEADAAVHLYMERKSLSSQINFVALVWAYVAWHWRGAVSGQYGHLDDFWE